MNFEHDQSSLSLIVQTFLPLKYADLRTDKVSRIEIVFEKSNNPQPTNEGVIEILFDDLIRDISLANAVGREELWSEAKGNPVCVRMRHDPAPILMKVETLYDCYLASFDPAVPIHIFGKSGTGKERVARLIAELSFYLHKGDKGNTPREASKFFTQVSASVGGGEMLLATLFGTANATGTPARMGLFEKNANVYQTVFLDEIHWIDGTVQNELKIMLQNSRQRLFRRIGDGEAEKMQVYSGRLITASNVDIRAERTEGPPIHADFAARIAGRTIVLPELKEWVNQMIEQQAPDYFKPIFDLIYNQLSERLEKSGNRNLRPPMKYESQDWHQVLKNCTESSFRQLESQIQTDFYRALLEGKTKMTPATRMIATTDKESGPGAGASIDARLGKSLGDYLELNGVKNAKAREASFDILMLLLDDLETTEPNIFQKIVAAFNEPSLKRARQGFRQKANAKPLQKKRAS